VSPAKCPRPEEFSALLDRELAPEEIPNLERHVTECRVCRELFYKLAAADRMFGLVLGKVNLVDQCLKVKPGEQDAASDELVEQLEAMGRTERARAMQDKEVASARRRVKWTLILILLVLLGAGGFAATLELAPVADLGTAKRKGAFVVGPGEVKLCRGAKVRLSDDARAVFWCRFRWDQPGVTLKAGRLELLEGVLHVRIGGEVRSLLPGYAALIGPDGKLTFEGEESEAPPPPDGAKPESAAPKAD
jgi:hypothetical protein